ncbi:MAG: hypothetical protein WKF94_10825 [Solirubrobacteraceae bacterium]
MANVQIRGVPEDVHSRLKQLAAARGQSLNEYMLKQLGDLALMPTWSEMTERIARRGPSYTGPSSAAIIREDRDSR